MSEETGGILKALLSILPKEAREFIGIYMMAFAPIIIISVVMILQNMAQKSSEEDKKCWSLQELQNKAYKINQCTGEVVELSKITASNNK